MDETFLAYRREHCIKMIDMHLSNGCPSRGRIERLRFWDDLYRLIHCSPPNRFDTYSVCVSVCVHWPQPYPLLTHCQHIDTCVCNLHTTPTVRPLAHWDRTYTCISD